MLILSLVLHKHNSKQYVGYLTTFEKLHNTYVKERITNILLV